MPQSVVSCVSTICTQCCTSCFRPTTPFKPTRSHACILEGFRHEPERAKVACNHTVDLANFAVRIDTFPLAPPPIAATEIQMR